MLKGAPLIVVGILLILLGLAGAVGLLDRSRITLYRGHQQREPSAGRHRPLQRAGGVAVGGAFVYAGLTD